jgi:hypothetical protein
MTLGPISKNCDYCGVEFKNYPFFYKLGRFVGEDLICPVCFNEYFKGSLGKDRARKGNWMKGYEKGGR